MVTGADGQYHKSFDPIIERNMTVPVSRVHQYVAIDEDQKELRIKIYQGENPDPDENVFLGEIVHEIQSGSLADSMTSVRFTYDRNGILEVVTQNLKNKEKKRAIMLNNNALTDEEIAECLEKISELKVHTFENEENLYLLSKAEKLVELLTDAEKKHAFDLTELFRDALQSDNEVRVTKAKTALLLFFEKHKETM